LCDSCVSFMFCNILHASITHYIITQVILAFWLVLAYDLLEDRCTDDDSGRFKVFWIFWILNLNQSWFFAKHQFASFFIDIRSRQCYFRVCQSGEIWNKRTFFPWILIFLLYKTNRDYFQKFEWSGTKVFEQFINFASAK